MPKDTRHVETGLLLEGQRPANLILKRDGGGVWQLDASAAVWAYLGRRVRGVRAVTCTPDWYRSEVESFALMADG
jgi:hypothetical protein